MVGAGAEVPSSSTGRATWLQQGRGHERHGHEEIHRGAEIHVPAGDYRRVPVGEVPPGVAQPTSGHDVLADERIHGQRHQRKRSKAQQPDRLQPQHARAPKLPAGGAEDQVAQRKKWKYPRRRRRRHKRPKISEAECPKGNPEPQSATLRPSVASAERHTLQSLS
jgi:hypothetical protein